MYIDWLGGEHIIIKFGENGRGEWDKQTSDSEWLYPAKLKLKYI